LKLSLPLRVFLRLPANKPANPEAVISPATTDSRATMEIQHRLTNL
jgi:hypothetical protein